MTTQREVSQLEQKWPTMLTANASMCKKYDCMVRGLPAALVYRLTMRESWHNQSLATITNCAMTQSLQPTKLPTLKCKIAKRVTSPFQVKTGKSSAEEEWPKPQKAYQFILLNRTFYHTFLSYTSKTALALAIIYANCVSLEDLCSVDFFFFFFFLPDVTIHKDK